jgi:hypothetical protein
VSVRSAKFGYNSGYKSDHDAHKGNGQLRDLAAAGGRCGAPSVIRQNSEDYSFLVGCTSWPRMLVVGAVAQQK